MLSKLRAAVVLRSSSRVEQDPGTPERRASHEDASSRRSSGRSSGRSSSWSRLSPHAILSRSRSDSGRLGSDSEGGVSTSRKALFFLVRRGSTFLTAGSGSDSGSGSGSGSGVTGLGGRGSPAGCSGRKSAKSPSEIDRCTLWAKFFASRPAARPTGLPAGRRPAATAWRGAARPRGAKAREQ